MGRKRRPITPDGYLACNKCGRIRHITEFYCTSDHWVEIEGKWYGKPMAWCKKCTKEYQQARATAKSKAIDELRRRELQSRVEWELETQRMFTEHVGPPVDSNPEGPA